ncbi:MAG: hypothetical protein Q4D94_03095 [Bacillota bacterium]|nr:hypothetical protein [Bacillota bacterium]
MTDESLMLDIDIIEKEHEQQLAEKDREFERIVNEKDNALKEKDRTLKKQNNALKEKDSQILALQERIKQLEQQQAT